MGRGLHYSIRKDKPYFLTMTVVEWIDLFTRKNHKELIVESLDYCQKNKGLHIYGWCLMPSHLHLIGTTDNGFETDLSFETARFLVASYLPVDRSFKTVSLEWWIRNRTTTKKEFPNCLKRGRNTAQRRVNLQLFYELLFPVLL